MSSSFSSEKAASKFGRYFSALAKSPRRIFRKSNATKTSGISVDPDRDASSDPWVPKIGILG